MRDYAELVSDLHICGGCNDGEVCQNCSRFSRIHDYENGDAADPCADELLLDAADAIEELQAQVPHWISVEERLPEHYRVVLVIKDHPVDYLHGYEFAARLQNGEWSGNSRKVLFWMPLPEPPEGVE